MTKYFLQIAISIGLSEVIDIKKSGLEKAIEATDAPIDKAKQVVRNRLQINKASVESA